MTVLAPAKINLGLKVFPKRPDGYHDIQSLFTTVNLFDEITVSVADKKGLCRVECDSMVLPEDNTFVKAYKAFCVLTGVEHGISIRVTKRIPAGGGLGGGSSDASSLIQSMDSIFGTHLDCDSLTSLAGEVGSDVFFFTAALLADGGRRFKSYEPFAAIVGGRGELVSQIQARKDYSVLLVFPGVSVSTKEAYNLVDGRNESCEIGRENFALESMYGKPVNEWTFSNDFTVPVCMKKVAIAGALRRLKTCGADFADMSGSGSTVYGIFRDCALALEAKRLLLEENFQVVLA